MMTPKQKVRQQAVLTLAHNDYEKGLNAHAFFKVHDHAMGEDLVQDTFMKTWNYLSRGGKIETMKAFLYHALNCLIIDEYRKRKTTSLDALLDNGFSLGSNDSERLVDALDGKSAFLLIARLPEKYQKVMRMRFTQNLSLTEMSQVTGETKNAMAVQVHRGLEKLKLLYSHA